MMVSIFNCVQLKSEIIDNNIIFYIKFEDIFREV